MKTCNRCNITKDLTLFPKSKSCSDGHRNYCKTCNAKDAKRHAENRKAEIQAYQKQYRIDNLTKLQKYHSDYLKNGGAGVRKKYRTNNPERIKLLKNHNEAVRRRSKQLSSLTGTEYSNWVTTQLKICTYCGISCSNLFHVDHIEPLSKGGLHELDNLTIACQSCNTSKGQKSLLEFLAFKQNTK